MTSPIYDLLPAHIRTRDQEEGGTLRALFALMEREGSVVEDDIRRLGETWFIETCPPWAIPYIGQLLDVRALHDLGPDSGFSERAWVGNTIRNRQRKGTLGAIEAVASEATGLPARANELFEHLSATQWLNHTRLHRNAAARVRDGDAMALTGSAFDRTPRSVDVRKIERGGKRYNIPNISIHLWRLQPYRLPSVEAARLSGYQFTLDPLGRDLPLYWGGRTETDAIGIASMLDLPVPLDRRPLFRELEAARQAITDGRTPVYDWFGANPAVALEVQEAAGDPFVAVDPAEIAIRDLHDTTGSDWRRPPAGKDYTTPSGATEERTIRAGLDPVRGRVALPADSTANALRATYTYAAPGDLGGGSYDRRLTAEALLGRAADFQVGVSKRLPGDGATIVPSIAEAIGIWNGRPAGEAGLIVLMDNDRFEEDLIGPNAAILREGSALAIVAADWPEEPVEGGGMQRRTGRLIARDRRAALVGPLEVVTEVALGAPVPARFTLDGLLMAGNLSFSGAAGTAFGEIRLSHSAIAPAAGGVTVTGASVEERLHLERCISGRLALAAVETELQLRQSIVDGQGGPAIQADVANLSAEAVTVLGDSSVGEVFATDCLFDGSLVAARTQAGCLQTSAYSPAGSRTPRRYRCQPDLALRDQPATQHDAIIAGLRPLFASIRFGDPNYGRLDDRAARQLWTGAAHGDAMGAWGFLNLGWRETNLRIAIDEYLPFGLAAGPVYET